MPTLGGPPELTITVTLGCDRQFQVQQADTQNNPVDFDATVYINVGLPTIDTVQATVSGAVATFLLPSSLCDSLLDGTDLQICKTDNVTGLKTPLFEGRFTRRD